MEFRFASIAWLLLLPPALILVWALGLRLTVLGRARSADLGAAEALEQREYAPALALFQAAEKLYRDAASLQAKRESVLATLKATQDSMNLADRAFQTEARPASFERGKQLLADARKALEEEDLDGAKRLFGQATQSFAKAHGEADMANELAKAQEAWGAALANTWAAPFRWTTE